MVLYQLSYDPITAELKKFGRAGVPLVLVYPADAGRPPIVLPEVLTPKIVLDALAKAASNAPSARRASEVTKQNS